MPDPQRLIDVYCEAERIPPGPDRDHFLDQQCRDDKEREEVLALLKAKAESGEFLNEKPALSTALEAELSRLRPEEAGDRIGPYKLREQIGEGGFGVVWVAEQQVPVRRAVALKIIKLGMDTREVVARFEQERQALAVMDHPNIAKVFDAGATDHGRPFFVMELVRGIKITDYCDQTNLNTKQRLELFIQVCNAVQHAHQKGIIHRDLKPSNILVTMHDGVAVPKVIDFGVAKATQGRLGDLSIYTRFEQMIGTPLYMSPEQAEMSGLDVDTRTDIYALGVLLYELLTGGTPFDPDRLTKIGCDEMRRVIREEEPQKPSTALNTMAKEKLTAVAHHRSSEPPKLIHAIHGDLDWIVMKTLEKDRSRRYDSADGLAEDLRRYLANEPVLASPPSVLYRLRKLTRRHLPVVIASSLTLLALIVGLVATTWGMLRANRAERQAAAEQRDGATQLFAALVAQARATRFSGQPGRRFDTLELLERARRLGRELQVPDGQIRALRREYTAALSLTDLQLGAPWIAFPRSSVASDFDESLTICAVVNERGDCSIRRTQDDSQIYLIPGRGGLAITSLSPDAKYVAVFHLENKDSPRHLADLWELGISAPKRVFSEVNVQSASWRGSELIALGYPDGSIRVFRLSDGTVVHTLSAGNASREMQVALHPSEPLIATASYFGNGVEIRDIRDGSLVHFMPHEHRVSCLTWTPDGSQLALGTEAARVNLYQKGTWNLGASLSAQQVPTSIAFAKSGKAMALNGWAGLLEVIDLSSGTPIMKWGPVSQSRPRFSPDGLQVAAAVRDGRLGILRMSSPTEVRQISRKRVTPGVNYLMHDVHPGGRLVAACMSDGVAFLDLLTGEQVGFIRSPSIYNRVRFETSGNLLTNSISGTFRWPIRTQPDATDTFEIGAPERLPLPVADQMAQSKDCSVTATSHRRAGATFSFAGARILGPGHQVTPLNLEPGADIHGVEVSPDGKWVVTATHASGIVKLWNAQTGELVRELISRYGVSPMFSPDGQWLVVSGNGGMTFSTASWSPIRTTDCSVAVISPDSRLVAEMVEDGVRLVEIATGKEIAFLEKLSPEGRAQILFSPDGNRLLVLHAQSGIEVWDLALIRHRLQAIDLDWDWPAFTPKPVDALSPAPPLKVKIQDENSHM